VHAPSLGSASAKPPRSPKLEWPRAFTSLRQRNFRLFWFGQMVSLTGTYMQSIGQAWLVLDRTHSALQIGVVGALQYLGVLLFSLFGGVFADRWPKRRILLFTQSAAMLQALLLWALVATGTLQIWHLYVLALLLGLTSSLDSPARQAFVVELVGREDVSNAVALNSSLGNLARVIGPGLGGVIIAASGEASLFLLNGVSFLAVIAGLALIDNHALFAQASRKADASEPQTTWQRLWEGMRYIGKTPTIALLIVVSGLALLFGSNFGVALPLVATRVLDVGARGFGFLSAAFSVGALISALLMAWGGRRPTIRLVLFSALAFAVLEAFFALSHSYPLSLALIASVGFMENSFATLSVVILQVVSPDHLRARVMSVCILFFDGSVPLGYTLTGWLSDALGVAIALLICALLTLLVVAGGWLWSQRAGAELAEPAR
jgi:MFS family permease